MRAKRLSLSSPSKDKLETLYVSEREGSIHLKKEVRTLFERMLVGFKTEEIKGMLLDDQPLKKLYAIVCDMEEVELARGGEEAGNLANI